MGNSSNVSQGPDILGWENRFAIIIYSNRHTMFIRRANRCRMDNSTEPGVKLECAEIAQRLYGQLGEFRHKMVADAEAMLASWRPSIKRTEFVSSAANLASYLAFRKADLRPLQAELPALGLSSLGRCEAHVRASVDALRAPLARIAVMYCTPYPSLAEFSLGKDLLDERRD